MIHAFSENKKSQHSIG
ncbi:hypothetical protein AYI70_g2870, partial [Smittium culicis]